MPSSPVATTAVVHNLDSLSELPLRRLPRQQRSRKRVASMLSTAIDLLVVGGTESVTTSSVAERAQVPIGSVYQFFPDRETLLLAVAEVCSRPMQEATESMAAHAAETPNWEAFIATVFGQLQAQWSAHPADIAAWHSLVSVPNMDSVTGPIFYRFVSALSEGVTLSLAQRATAYSPEEIQQRCWILTTSFTSVLAASLATGRDTAVESFLDWASCLFRTESVT